MHKRPCDRAGRSARSIAGVGGHGGNVFAELMETVKWASLGRISRALYAVGSQYRRNM